MNLRTVRAAMERFPDVASQESLDPPAAASIHVPRLHPKAIGLDASVVVGMRGAGKSWWTAVLADQRTRRIAARTLGEGVEVRVGFGLDETNQRFPSAREIARMRSAGIDPTDVWWTVVLHHAAGVAGLRPGARYPAGWTERAKYWSAGNRRELTLNASDAALEESSRKLLVLIDAFDRVSSKNDWDDVRALTTAALQVCLALRSRRAIRLKLFLRPDLEEDERIWRFSDSSKLRQGKVELTWQVGDLYAMLWARLANDSQIGEQVAEWLRSDTGVRVGDREGVVIVDAISNDDQQRRMMESIASPFMGKDRKRGLTYRWIPLHLSDALGRVSPRSWLIAFRRAAEWTEGNRPSFDRALHYEGIQQGVVKASETRVAEIEEDHPWVGSLLRAARDMHVPCRPEELVRLWTRDHLPPTGKGTRLPPRHFTTDPIRKGEPVALIGDLAELAVLYRTADDRINIPDIFRVQFGIRRRGGVKPPR